MNSNASDSSTGRHWTGAPSTEHPELLGRSTDRYVLLGYLTNSELFVWAPINCRAERLLEVFVRADVAVVG